MKHHHLCMRAFLAFGILLTAFPSYSQTNTLPANGNIGIGTLTPTERLTVNGSAKIDSSLTVRDSVTISRNLTVEQDVRFMGNTKMNTLRVGGNFIANDLAKFNNDVKLTNLSTINANNYGNFSFLMANPNGLIKKTDTEALSAYLKGLVYSPPAPSSLTICDLAGYTDNPFWANGPQKLYSECPSVLVGIGTKTPTHLLTVAGSGKFNGHLWVNNSLSVGTDMNTFSKLNILNTNRTAAIQVNQSGNNQQYQRLIFMEYSNPDTRIMEVINTTTNHTPFSLGVDGDMRIHNGTGEIFHLYSNGVLSLKNGTTENFRVENNGLIRGRRMKLDLNTWADYVFDETYQLMPLNELEVFVKREKHLPNIPSEQELKKQGADVMELNKLLMEKVEELTLYLIQQNKHTEELKKQLDALQEKITELETTRN